MTDDTQRRGLIADLTRRLALAGHDELRVLDRVLLRFEQLRYTWRRPSDGAGRWHLAQTAAGSWVTRCAGRWSERDTTECNDAPPVLERCPACQRAAWSDSTSELDPLIAAVLELMAAEDLARANLRNAAHAEMLGGDQASDEPAALMARFDLGGEAG